MMLFYTELYLIVPKNNFDYLICDRVSQCSSGCHVSHHPVSVTQAEISAESYNPA